MTGGAGSDVFVLDPDAGTDRIVDFQVGTDQLDLSLFSAAIAAGAGELSFEATADGAVLSWQDQTITILRSGGGSLAESDIVSAGFDWVTPIVIPAEPTDLLLTGDIDDNILVGHSGNDTLYGGDGNDTLTGGAGADDLNGGSGVDTVSYADATSRVNLDLRSRGTYGDAANDTFTSIENVTASAHDDYVYGDSGNNVIDGGAGDDRLRGHNGNDTLIGGAGDDNLSGGSGADTFVFGAFGGVDTVIDYLDGVDVLRITESISFGDLSITQDGTSVSIGYGSGGIVLENTHISEITADDFVFG
jgi:Ca2+-binding RTX toxin-like protein